MLFYRHLPWKSLSFRLSHGFLITILLGYVPCVLAQGIRRSDQDLVSSISVALRNREFDRALETSRAAVQKFPADERLWTLQGVAYSEVGKPKLALASFQRALKNSPDYLPALEGEAQLAYIDANYRGKDLAEHILLLRPGDPLAHAILAEIDSKKADCQDSIGHFQQASKLLDDHPRALIEYGVCLANLNRYNEAIPVFQRLADLEPNKPAALYNLALIEWKSNRVDDAIAVLEPLVQGSDPDASILILAADIHESKGETQKAIELLREAIQSHPENKEAYLDVAILSANHNSFSVGIEMLNVGLKYLPKQSELYLVRGVLYCQLGDTTKGITDFETADRINPKLSFPGIAEGLAESQAHKSGEALSTFRVQAQKHPNDPLAQYLFAEALSEHGEPEGTSENREEVRAAQLAVKLDPTLSAAHDLLATNYLRARKTDLAIQESQEALRSDPSDQQALYHLILAMRKSGNNEKIRVLVDHLLKARDADKANAKPLQLLQIIDIPASSSSFVHSH